MKPVMSLHVIPADLICDNVPFGRILQENGVSQSTHQAQNTHNQMG